MSVKSSKSSQYSKIARYSIDILAVYQSESDLQVSLDEAMSKIRKMYSGKLEHEKPHVIKCVMHILESNDGYVIMLKSHNNKKILESFSMKSIGTPQVGQIFSQGLVFLPVLNYNCKSELFVFHPNTVSAQEIAINLIRLKQSKNSHQDGSEDSLCPPKSDPEENSRSINNLLNNPDKRGDNEYSLSSNFLNNWFSKLEHIVTTNPNSPYQRSEYSPSINSTNDELSVLHMNMREIRTFMNNLYASIEKVTHSVHNGNKVVKLPSKAQFIEIVRKIKSSLNITAIHEASIVKPTAKNIVNQLLLILKIIGDATEDRRTEKPYLLLGISDPYINGATAKYLRDNLTPDNIHFWMSLGRNYGYDAPSVLNGADRLKREFEEFQVNQDILTRSHKVRHGEGSEDLAYHRTKEVHQCGTNTGRYGTKYWNEGSIDDDNEVDTYTRRNIYRDNLNMNSSLRQTPHLRDPGMSMHEYQNSDTRTTNHDRCTSGWNDTMCRFIDSVLLRNGRLLRISRDKLAQNNEEISVHCNEIVELLSDQGDIYSVKNSYGEVGYCPASIAAHIVSSSL